MKLKVPYFKQEKNTNCGVACLKMVFAFYGMNVVESELEEACETSWLGNTCGELVQGSMKYEFMAEEVENINIDYVSTMLRKEFPLVALLDPAVLYGGLEGFGHFVVITGLKGDKIYYNDPDMGKDLKVNVDDFFNAWERFSLKGVKIWKSTKR
jgi:ABC-type bacteriocin/lantibiotic exporter with double-glycine peptidase domain